MSESGSLRELLARQFGVELPISGGSGSRDAPIVVTAANLQDAVDAQAQVLQFLGAARRVAWRMTAQEVVSSDQKAIQTTIETVELANSEVVIQHEAIFFVLEALPANGTATALPVARGFVDPRSGVCLPRQLGWLHLRGATDNTGDDPGLGWSVAYDSQTIQGTVYVYDRQARLASDEVETERVIEEFKTAVNDALAVNSDAAVKHQALFRDPSGRGRCYLAILDLPGDSMSAVLLTALNGCFVKARLTFDATERKYGQMAHESMDAFVDALRPGPATAS